MTPPLNDIERRALLVGGLALAADAAPSITQAQEEKAMYGLIGQMKAATGKRDELIAILSEGTEGMPGRLSYIELKMEEVMRLTLHPHPVEFDMYYKC